MALGSRPRLAKCVAAYERLKIAPFAGKGDGMAGFNEARDLLGILLVTQPITVSRKPDGQVNISLCLADA